MAVDSYDLLALHYFIARKLQINYLSLITIIYLNAALDY